jgi:hypothetical protein
VAAGDAAAGGQDSSHPSIADMQDGHLTIGPNLEPALYEACGGRLREIHWFRTDWQRGGALTGYATWREGGNGDACEHRVVVKLPVPPIERRWLVQLQGEQVAPVVYAHGDSLGRYDFCWVVMERLPHGPLGGPWGGKAFDLIIEAVARFSRAASRVPCDGPLRRRDYHQIFQQARDHLHEHGIAHEQRWNRAFKAAHRRLDEWLAMWNSRPANDWCHGDVHLGNAMTRAAPPDGPALLIDFAEVHRGHWVEDAVHLEHLYWSKREKLEGRRICKLIARQRKALGLAVEEDWAKYASLYRALLAMCTPAVMRHMGEPHHVHAALEVLEGEVGL